MITTYIGVGSNIEREKHVRVALEELEQLGEGLRCSTVYDCAAVGFSSHSFYNLVVELKTSYSLRNLMQKLREIELKWGREPDAQKLQDRTLDLDIILFGEQVSAACPQLPRDDIFKFAFVIQPLYELCPNRVIPQDGRTVAQIWQTHSDLDSLIAVDLFK